MKKDKQVPTRSEERANIIISENVIDRLLDRKSYIALKEGGKRKHKWFITMVIILACLPVISFIALITGYDSKGYEFVTMLCILAFIVLSIPTMILGLLLLNGAKATKMDEFIADNNGILQKYFIDFVKAKLPQHGKTYTTLFSMDTSVDDRAVDSRAIKMTGLCRFDRHSTELSVTLRFNPSYSKLVVQDYDLAGLEK